MPIDKKMWDNWIIDNSRNIDELNDLLVESNDWSINLSNRLIIQEILYFTNFASEFDPAKLTKSEWQQITDQMTKLVETINLKFLLEERYLDQLLGETPAKHKKHHLQLMESIKENFNKVLRGIEIDIHNFKRTTICEIIGHIRTIDCKDFSEGAKSGLLGALGEGFSLDQYQKHSEEIISDIVNLPFIPEQGSWDMIRDKMTKLFKYEDDNLQKAPSLLAQSQILEQKAIYAEIISMTLASKANACVVTEEYKQDITKKITQHTKNLGANIGSNLRLA